MINENASKLIERFMDDKDFNGLFLAIENLVNTYPESKADFLLKAYDYFHLKKGLEQPPKRNIKIAGQGIHDKDLTEVNQESDFSLAITEVFSEYKPSKIIETGTYLGTGTTQIIASTIKRLKLNSKFFSIEVNPHNYQSAIQNIKAAGLSDYVTLLNGLSVPRSILPSEVEIKKNTVSNIEFDEIFVDHNENDRVKLYYAETNFKNVPENLLEKCLVEFAYSPDFVLLDSAGHMGEIEFNFLISRLKKECLIALDDIYHIKHHKNFKLMQGDKRFDIITSSKEKFGFCVAKFTPAILPNLRPKSILFIRLDAIGDSVLASSMLKEIYNHYKDCTITVLCLDFVSEIYEACPYVGNIIKINRGKIAAEKDYLNNILTTIAKLNPEFIFNSTYSRDNISDLISTFNKTSKMYAHEGDLSNINEQDKIRNDRLYTKLIRNNNNSLTELDRHSDFLNELGIQHDQLVPTIWMSKEDEEYSLNIFKENGLQKENTLALFCGAQHSIRLYENLGKAVDKFCCENNFNVIVLGSDKDKFINEKNIKDISVKVVDLTGRTSIRQSSAILKNCAVAVGEETGLAHISCAVGTPNVILVGGGHFGRFMPYSNLTSVVTLSLECFGCNWQCKYGYPFCVKDILPELIYKALSEKLNRNNSKIRIYAQSEYPYNFISFFPQAAAPNKLLKEGSYEIINLPKVDLQPEGKFRTDILKSIDSLKLDENVKTHLIALYELYLNNSNSFEEITELEDRVVNSVSYATMKELNSKIQNGFTYYLTALSATDSDMEKQAVDDYRESLKYFQNYRALYLNAILLDRLNYLNNAIWLYAELLRLKINEIEIKGKIELLKQILNLNFYNRLRAIKNENEIKMPDLYFNPDQSFPEISIILPSKNRMQGANAFLKSLEYSCYKINFEILLYTGDDLTEDHQKIIKEYNISKVFHDSEIFNKNENFSWTKLMQHGFNNASGKWIMYASDDIIMHPFAINYALSLADDKAIGGISFMHRNTMQDYDGLYKDYGFESLANRLFINFGLIRRSAYEKVKGFDPNFQFYAGDQDLCWQLIEKNYQIITSEYSLVDHINIEDKIKSNNSSDVYDYDLKMFLRKWLNYLNSCDAPIYRIRYYLSDINKIKTRIFSEAITRGLNKEFLFSMDNDYREIEKKEIASPKEIKVSAIISTYNSERFIKGCIEDLINQTLYKNDELEIIVIDSGSEQNEQNIVAEYVNGYKNISYHRTEKETIYQAWNRGIKLARGKYLTNANADDRHVPDCFEKMVSIFDSTNDYDVVYADVYQTDIENDNIDSPSKKKLIKWSDFDKDLLLFGCFIGPQPAWRKSLHEHFGYFDENLKVVGDYEFWLRISGDAKFYHINEALGLYLFNNDSAEHRDKGLTSTEDALVREEYISKHITSAVEINRVKNKITFVSQAENLQQYCADAIKILHRREDGFLLEAKIKQGLNSQESENSIRQLLVNLDNTTALLDKNIFREVLLLTLGIILLKEDKIEQSKEEFEKALNLNPQSSEACTGLAEIFLIEERFDAANIMYEWALKINPENKLASERKNQLNIFSHKDENLLFENKMLAKAIHYFLVKDYLKTEEELIFAESTFNGQLTEEKNYLFAASFYNLKGFNYLGLNDLENARKVFEKALNIYPESSKSCDGLAEVFYSEGNYEAAKTMFEYAVKFDPENQNAQDGLNRLSTVNQSEKQIRIPGDKKNDEELEIVLNEIIDKIYVLFTLKKYNEAITALENTQELFYSGFEEGGENKLISIYENLKGFNYLGLNETGNARECFEIALNLNPESSQACAGLGEVFFLEGKDREAKVMFEWGLKYNLDNGFAAEGLKKTNSILGIEETNNSLLMVK